MIESRFSKAQRDVNVLQPLLARRCSMGIKVIMFITHLVIEKLSIIPVLGIWL